MTSRLSRYHVQVDENITVCDGPTYEDICILTSTIPDYEMQALKDLYDSTDGDNWRWWNGGNGASNEDRHQQRDYDSQVLEPVVIGELVSMVAGAVATDNEILNLPTASVANIDEEDVLYVDIFIGDRSELITIDVVNDTWM